MDDSLPSKVKEEDCIYLLGRKDKDTAIVTADSLVALFTLQCCSNPALNVVLVDRKENSTQNSGTIKSENDVWVPVDVKTLSFPLFCIDEDKCPDMIKSCLLPAVLTSCNPWCVAGLCASLRFMLRKTVEMFPNHFCQKFLGFRGGCLQACAEVSVWTKFCEIESIKTFKDFYNTYSKNNKTLIFPKDILRFEHHLQHPPILHNALKRKQYLIKKNVLDKVHKQELCTKKLSELPELEHEFAEGLDMTLADIMLFGNFYTLLSVLKKHVLLDDVCPLVARWFNLLSCNEYVKNSLPVLGKLITMPSFCNKDVSTFEITIPVVPPESLYKSDPERYKPRWRSYTHQHDIERILKVLEEAGVDPGYDAHPSGQDLSISWSSYPPAVSPVEGQLPAKRLQRKCQQLENIVSAVMQIARDGDIIVDFCAGGGHVGIVLAYCLPNCKILFVENSETSLMRAYKRIEALGIPNVQFFQSNLDYFHGFFNVGVCLHACGVATDLVLQKCLNQRAAFVCCPCCYGGVQTNHILEYPRSQLFCNLTLSLNDYLILGHAADQTHDETNPKTKQGQKCMQLIDTDRLALAQSYGYLTRLVLMKPKTCSPKNHLLIGLPEN
ncbi:glutathione S-transferase C-terminal domain-containing protein homolog [Penaeus japonicus]|uniref:glutathione S-transferase C-terminal domain-containing protein homolog n=1 Tax=Penaeus japonicus TaxID=27405 RepID=UPI001C713BF1|nr:glutathione S-transferase C-terminal domain-containing protein homolog [Penaeus japonicus]